jgi:hypothetical protein
LKKALHGVDKLYLLNAVMPDELTQGLIAYDLAKRLKLKHIVYGGWIKQIADRDLNPLRRRSAFLTYEQADVCVALLQLFHDFCTNFAGAASHQNLHGITVSFICLSNCFIAARSKLSLYICFAEPLGYTLWRNIGLHQRNTVVGSTEMSCFANRKRTKPRADLFMTALVQMGKEPAADE